MSASTSSPIDHLPQHLKDQTVRMYKQTHEAQLNNFQQILSTLQRRNAEIHGELESYQAMMEELHAEEISCTERMEEAKKNIAMVQQILRTMAGDIPDGMIADPHTGLSLRIKEICGNMSLGDTDYVSVIFEDTDQCNRWVPLDYILEDNRSKQLYEAWCKWKDAYESRFPNAPQLCRTTEFQGALHNEEPPKETTCFLYPMYQLVKNGPKYHFKRIVNTSTLDDGIYAVVIDISDKRQTIPTYAFQKCDLARALWNNWWIAYNEMLDLGTPLSENEDYTVEDFCNMRMKLAIPVTPLNTPSPNKRRKVGNSSSPST